MRSLFEFLYKSISKSNSTLVLGGIKESKEFKKQKFYGKWDYAKFIPITCNKSKWE